LNSWKSDVDILHAAQYDGRYGGFSKGHLHVDRDDRLWLPLTVYFPDAEQRTDAWAPVQKNTVLISEDKGLIWSFTDQPFPGPSHNRVTLSDETIVEVGGSGYLRYPRTEVERLEEDGYHVWDLGPENDYCAIVYGMWQKRSTDGGNTWEKREIHQQLPHFAHFVARGPLRLLDDGSLVYFAYGCTPEERIPVEEDPTAATEGFLHRYGHGRWSAYCVRSDDSGETWQSIRAADGRLSPSVHGFNETFPIIGNDGSMFVVLRTELGSHAYSVSSSDGGRTWTEAVQTPIRAKHPLPTLLRDGAIVCSYQRRFAAPFGVRARFTSDRGETWGEEIVLRDDILLSDGLAESDTVEFSDGTLFTAFQATKPDDQGRQRPFVAGTRWTRDYRGPFVPGFEIPEPGEKFNAEGNDQ
jgi:hypothetical protein